jgi:N-acetyl-anhydromuramyl-L-alanine amidase AmpD
VVNHHGHPNPPQWQDLSAALPRHPTKRYAQRKTSDVRYLVISHSAIPGSVHPATIARFHIEHVGWPGIGYHFYLDDQGQIFKTNELTAVSHHVGQWDPVSIGICVGGNFQLEIPTPAQLESTAQLTAWLLHELDLPLRAIRGKSEFVDADSPGKQWQSGRKWKSTLIERVSEILQSWD